MQVYDNNHSPETNVRQEGEIDRNLQQHQRNYQQQHQVFEKCLSDLNSMKIDPKRIDGPAIVNLFMAIQTSIESVRKDLSTQMMTMSTQQERKN